MIIRDKSIYGPKTFVLILILLVCAFRGFSQFSFFKNYTVNDGLPSSKIYDMLQDRQGYMWFATENGVSRFDGYSFTNFTTTDGLPTNSTLKLYEDYKGRIWFLSYEGTVSYFDGKRVKIHPLFNKIISPNVSFLDQIYIDTTDQIYLSGFKKDLYQVKNGEVIVLEETSRGPAPRTNYLRFEKKENGYIFSFADPKRYAKDQEVARIENALIMSFRNDSRIPWSQKHCLENHRNDLLVSLGPLVKWIRDEEVIRSMKLDNHVLMLYEDDDRNLWLSEKFNGLWMYPGGNIDKEPLRFMLNNSISDIIQDYEGNYWFSTTEYGVFLVPSIQFRTFNKQNLQLENDVVITFEMEDDLLFFATAGRQVYKGTIINNILTDVKTFKPEGTIGDNINDLLISSNGLLWITNTEYLRYDFNGKAKRVGTLFRHSGYKIYELFNGSILVGQPGGYYKYRDDNLEYRSEDLGFNYRTFAIYAPSDSLIYLGTIDGLFIYKSGDFRRYSEDDPILNNRISDIKPVAVQIWLGTFDNGIAMIDDEEIRYVNIENGLSSNRIKVLQAGSNGSVWVGTNKGLNHIMVDPLEKRKFKILHYSIWDGLPTNEINDIIVRDDRVWLATDKGIVNFDPQGLDQNTISPKIRIEHFWVNEIPVDQENKFFNFKFNENNIRLDFKALSFINPGQIYYEYNLLGLDNQWIGTLNPSVRFPDLDPGEYTFSVRAKNHPGNWSDVQTIGFAIQKHFSQTTWFQIVFLTAILGIIILVFYWILLNQRRRENLRQQIVLAEQKAIRSQMNPHFIFNSLNSIQHFIIDRDEQKADSYLSKFSKLIRKILDSSKFNTISLREEVETLRLYLQLEQLRFGDKFDFDIEIDSRINPEETNIPTMIIQPIIENAIWHGLMPKKTAGKILISFELFTDKKIMVVVQDDGIGRERSGKINEKRKHHVPMGIENIRERLDLLNRLNKTNMYLNIIDLYGEDHQSAGTRVEIVVEF